MRQAAAQSQTLPLLAEATSPQFHRHVVEERVHTSWMQQLEPNFSCEYTTQEKV